MGNSYSILINSTDSFEDCWIPFFTLYKVYWPNHNAKIYLNTETKEFKFSGLDIISVQNNITTPNKKITWSECLIRAVTQIDNDLILYMQEDYFLKGSVQNEIVEKYVNLMHNNKDIHCIHLTDQAVIAEKKPSNFEGLYPVKNKQRYRISCQAALWRKDILLSYLRSYENAWQFEEFGSKRAAILKHNFFVVDSSLVKINEFEIIPYIFTGIVQGRWNEEVIPLFERNNIKVDFSIRGFINNSPNKSIRIKIINKLKKIPIILKSYSNLLFVKFVK